MKRLGHLYPGIYALENIREAHRNARRGKSHYTEVRRIDRNPDPYFLAIHELLKNKTFRNGSYTCFMTQCSGKDREIFKLPYFPDRVIHHAVMQITGPIWEKTLIADTYACIKGRGIHKAAKKIQRALLDQEATRFCLKCDVKKFYPSVDHGILKQVVRRKIKDPDLLWLLDQIIDSAEGLPIGNYLSQHFGNIYLSGLDHWVKERLNLKYYFRYCDDLVFLHGNKEVLHDVRARVSQYLSENLALQLKENWQVFPVAARGIDFLGYRFFPGYTLMRKRISQRMKKRVKRLKGKWRRMDPIRVMSAAMSYYGWAKHANCRHLMESVFDGDVCKMLDLASDRACVSNPLRKIPEFANEKVLGFCR